MKTYVKLWPSKGRPDPLAIHRITTTTGIHGGPLGLTLDERVTDKNPESGNETFRY